MRLLFYENVSTQNSTKCVYMDQQDLFIFKISFQPIDRFEKLFLVI